jgi:hypothetical protein
MIKTTSPFGAGLPTFISNFCQFHSDIAFPASFPVRTYLDSRIDEGLVDEIAMAVQMTAHCLMQVKRFNPLKKE